MRHVRKKMLILYKAEYGKKTGEGKERDDVMRLPLVLQKMRRKQIKD
jgi:hypothetical protein